jgi:murein DD-endopeptidase MepM/ murein hydrolase activator NlpD
LGLVRWLVLGLVVSGCGSSTTTSIPDRCDGYPDTATSPYVLPFPVGTRYAVQQGNCSGFGHSGFWKYSYDFDMPTGTPVAAARGGTVLVSHGEGVDGDVTRINLVVIEHDDGTVAVYSHLTHHGALVPEGATVRIGEVIGLSGNSGDTGGLPHLHFSVHPCSRLPGLPGGNATSCPTIPVTFRNAGTAGALTAWESYLALPTG